MPRGGGGGLFSAFESQDNMQFEYISFNMLIFLKNLIKCAKVGKNEHFFFFKTRKIMVFGILTFDFYLEEKRQM